MVKTSYLLEVQPLTTLAVKVLAAYWTRNVSVALELVDQEGIVACEVKVADRAEVMVWAVNLVRA